MSDFFISFEPEQPLANFEIGVPGPAGPQGPAGEPGPNSVTSATTSDGTASLDILLLEINDDGGAINVNGSDAAIGVTGANGTISVAGENGSIFADGENASIRTANGGYFETTSTYRINTGGFITTISGTQTADRAIAFPDASGTLALTSDITNSVTQFTTSDGTCDLSIQSLTVVTSPANPSAIDITTDTSVGISINTGSGCGVSITTSNGVAISASSQTANGADLTSSEAFGATVSSYSSTALQLNAVNGNYYVEFQNNYTTIEAAIERVRGWFVWFYNTFTGRLKTADITADRDWTLPDQSGTIAVFDDVGNLTVNGTLFANHMHGNIAGNVYTHVRAGEALTKGDPVYVSGSHGSGSTLIPIVSKADASNAAKMPAVGIVDADIANNANGHMVIVGTITELNTNAYAINDTLYVASGGGFTATPPAANSQPVARVERSNTNNGAVIVKVNGLASTGGNGASDANKLVRFGSSGTIPVASIGGLGTGVATALAVNVGSSGAFVVNGGALGTPSSGTLTLCTGLPISTGVSGLGTGVATALANNANSTGGVVTVDGTATLTNKTLTTPTINGAGTTTGTALTVQDSAATVRFRVRDDGRVSVGNITPNAQFDVGNFFSAQTGSGVSGQSAYVVCGPYASTVGGDAAAQFNITSNANNGYALFRFGIISPATGAVGEFGAGGSTASPYPNAVFFNTKGAFPLVFGSNNVERARILSSGEMGIGTSTPSTKAVLELSSTTKGFLKPRMTTTQRDAITSVPEGLEIFNTTTSKPNVYAGGVWNEVAAGLGTGVATALANTVNATGGVVTVDGTATLTNKTLTTPTIAQINTPSNTTTLLVTGGGTNGLFGLRSTLTTGYSSLELLGSGGSQMGGFGYANASAGAYADQVYFYSVGKALVIATAAGSRHLFLSTTGDLSIGSGAAANTRAVLDLTSTTKGFLPPRMTTTQRDAITSVPAGLMIYNTSTNKLNFYNGSAWEAVTSA